MEPGGAAANSDSCTGCPPGPSLHRCEYAWAWHADGIVCKDLEGYPDSVESWIEGGTERIIILCLLGVLGVMQVFAV